MRFRSIRLENVFAYDGLVDFAFPEPVEGRNIALIWGRNGMGKTSFLRALKLLFLGVEPPRVRSVGFPPKVLGQRQYVMGDGGNWSGLINRQAIRRADADGRVPSASVSATWVRDDGVTITAERNWSATELGYEEHAVTWDGQERLAGDAAKERIADLLPPEFVDFFFFDGEDIKSIAESDERKAIDFDRLLRITFIGEVSSELSRIIGERQRRGMGEELLEHYTTEEASLVRARGARDVARQGIAEADERIAADTAQLRRLQQHRENLQTGASETQRETLEQRRSELRRALADQEERIAASVPATAPLLANLGLVRAALAAVDLRLEASSTAERTFLGRVAPQLADWIREDAPAPAFGEAAEELAVALTRRMEGELPAGQASGLFATLDPLRAEQVRTVLTRWAIAGSDTLRAQTAELDAARRFQRELAEVEEALMRIEVGSQSNLDRYRATVAEIAALEERLAEVNQRKGQLRSRLDDAQARMSSHQARLAVLAESQDRAARDRDEARFLNRVVETLNDLRKALRDEVRGRLEQRINVRFAELVTDHGLVDAITIDDLYTMTFLDSERRPVGRASLSSGLKQLAATALLWAMKDVSGLDMPVVIDTPLGRIDRANQDNMLINYYPRLAGQVIILPTDTEIDARRLGLIEEHVGIQYRIENETGDRARLEVGSGVRV